MTSREALTRMILLLVACCLMERSCVQGAGRANMPAMYLLGDSSVDCGENTLLYPILHGNFSLFPCNAGNDSSLLPHFLADKAGLAQPQTFYSQSGPLERSFEQISKGVNYGSAQSPILENPNNQSFQSLSRQIRQLIESFQIIQLHLGSDDGAKFIKSSVFYLSFGKDDYVNLYQNKAFGTTYTSQEFARMLVNQMTLVIRSLYDFNARKIICMGILPIGCSPRVLFQNHSERECLRELNEFVFTFNELLNERIVNMNAQFLDALIVFCDVYQGMMEIIKNPTQYGFEDSTTACCGQSFNGALVGCMSEEMRCSEPSRHVWWDLYNPTQAVNKLLADAAWSDQPFSAFCRPFTVQELVTSTIEF